MARILSDVFDLNKSMIEYAPFLEDLTARYQGEEWWSAALNNITDALLTATLCPDRQSHRPLFITRVQLTVIQAILSDQGMPSDKLLVSTAAKIVLTYPDLAAHLVNSFMVEPDKVRELVRHYINAKTIGGRSGLGMPTCLAWLGQVRLVCGLVGHELEANDLPFDKLLQLAAEPITNPLIPAQRQDPAAGWRVLRDLDRMAAAAGVKIEDMMKVKMETPSTLQVLVLVLHCYRNHLHSAKLLGLDIRGKYVRGQLDVVIDNLEADIERHPMNSAGRNAAAELCRWAKEQRRLLIEA